MFTAVATFSVFLLYPFSKRAVRSRGSMQPYLGQKDWKTVFHLTLMSTHEHSYLSFAFLTVTFYAQGVMTYGHRSSLPALWKSFLSFPVSHLALVSSWVSALLFEKPVPSDLVGSDWVASTLQFVLGSFSTVTLWVGNLTSIPFPGWDAGRHKCYAWCLPTRPVPFTGQGQTLLGGLPLLLH